MKTVLLLEDDPISLALYRRVLGRRCAVLESRTPDDAIRICKSEGPDLFIADNLLDGFVSGLQTLLCAHEIRPDLPLLLVSGTPPEGFDDTDFHAFDILVRRGVCSFLQKPFTSEAFVSKAVALMDGRSDSSGAQRILDAATEYRRSPRRRG